MTLPDALRIAKLILDSETVCFETGATMNQNLRICVLAATGLWMLAGCGSDQANPPPSAAPASAPPPTATPVTTKPRQAAASPAKAVATGKSTNPRQRSTRLPDAPDSHRVEIGEDIPNFEIVPPDDPRSGAFVSLIHPPIGLDSTTVTLARPAPDASGNRTAAPPRARTGRAPSGFIAIAAAGASEEGLPRRIRCEKDGSEMALVPAGLFVQGMDGADEDAAPSHPVELSSFYIDVYEVTLGQYQKYWDVTRPLPRRPANHGGADDLPAVGITWKDATGYLEWVGKELPTEAEWEKAARGPNQFLYPWGNGRVLWHQSRTPEQIDPVGTFIADRSMYGVFDLAGNAREWCADLYADDAYLQAAGTTGAIVEDWTGPKTASKPAHRVVRGNADDWQVWHRSNAPMLAPDDDIGFRGVLRWPSRSDARRGSSSEPPPTVTPQRGN